MTGWKLKLKRVAARIKQWDVAVKVSISPAKLSLIENERREASSELVEHILAVIEELAGEHGLWSPTADQHAQAQVSKARGLELFAEKLHPTNNTQELVQAMEQLALRIDTVDRLNVLQTLYFLC